MSVFEFVFPINLSYTDLSAKEHKRVEKIFFLPNSATRFWFQIPQKESLTPIVSHWANQFIPRGQSHATYTKKLKISPHEVCGGGEAENRMEIKWVGVGPAFLQDNYYGLNKYIVERIVWHWLDDNQTYLQWDCIS